MIYPEDDDKSYYSSDEDSEDEDDPECEEFLNHEDRAGLMAEPLSDATWCDEIPKKVRDRIRGSKRVFLSFCSHSAIPLEKTEEKNADGSDKHIPKTFTVPTGMKVKLIRFSTPGNSCFISKDKYKEFKPQLEEFMETSIEEDLVNITPNEIIQNATDFLSKIEYRKLNPNIPITDLESFHRCAVAEGYSRVIDMTMTGPIEMVNYEYQYNDGFPTYLILPTSTQESTPESSPASTPRSEVSISEKGTITIELSRSFYGTYTDPRYRIHLNEILPFLHKKGIQEAMIIDFGCSGFEHNRTPIGQCNDDRWAMTREDFFKHVSKTSTKYGGTKKKNARNTPTKKRIRTTRHRKTKRNKTTKKRIRNTRRKSRVHKRTSK